MTRRLCLSGALVMAAIVCRVGAAAGHSFPASENPSAGQTLAAAPSEVSIRYDAPIEKLFASLQVLNAGGADQAVGPPRIGADGYTLSIAVRALAPGQYTVRWGVVCIDTHHTEGSYAFTVAGKAGQ